MLTKSKSICLKSILTTFYTFCLFILHSISFQEEMDIQISACRKKNRWFEWKRESQTPQTQAVFYQTNILDVEDVRDSILRNNTIIVCTQFWDDNREVKQKVFRKVPWISYVFGETDHILRQPHGPFLKIFCLTSLILKYVSSVVILQFLIFLHTLCLFFVINLWLNAFLVRSIIVS